jgi:hypothetical protein
MGHGRADCCVRPVLGYPRGTLTVTSTVTQMVASRPYVRKNVPVMPLTYFVHVVTLLIEGIFGRRTPHPRLIDIALP